jgi:hypothetical protein
MIGRQFVTTMLAYLPTCSYLEMNKVAQFFFEVTLSLALEMMKFSLSPCDHSR